MALRLCLLLLTEFNYHGELSQVSAVDSCPASMGYVEQGQRKSRSNFTPGGRAVPVAITGPSPWAPLSECVDTAPSYSLHFLWRGRKRLWEGTQRKRHPVWSLSLKDLSALLSSNITAPAMAPCGTLLGILRLLAELGTLYSLRAESI